jgi:hypothetical protein
MSNPRFHVSSYEAFRGPLRRALLAAAYVPGGTAAARDWRCNPAWRADRARIRRELVPWRAQRRDLYRTARGKHGRRSTKAARRHAHWRFLQHFRRAL